MDINLLIESAESIGSSDLPWETQTAPITQSASHSLSPLTKYPVQTRVSPNPSDDPVKKRYKWSPEEDALVIELRESGMKWSDISKRLPSRSPTSCRLHYQNYLERRSEWDEERKNKLARLYER